VVYTYTIAEFRCLADGPSVSVENHLMCYRGRNALSGYRVVQALGDGSSALVEWQLQTGRTHQIRSASPMHHPLPSYRLLYYAPNNSTVSTYRGELNAI